MFKYKVHLTTFKIVSGYSSQKGLEYVKYMFVATMKTNSLTVPHQVNPSKENTQIGNAIE